MAMRTRWCRWIARKPANSADTITADQWRPSPSTSMCSQASEEAIRGWKAHMEHAKAQEGGKRVWYADYQLRVAKVEREYGKGAR